MIELPECYVLSRQISETLVGKKTTGAIANQSPHTWAWFTGDPSDYNNKLTGQTVNSSNPGSGYTCGGNTEIIFDDFVMILSTPVKYHAPGTKPPPKHQLLLEFEDGSHMSCSVQMWGAMYLNPIGSMKTREESGESKKPDPYQKDFNKKYFKSLYKDLKPSLSVKAFLATDQRIPGLGNGVLQDILFNAKIHPKRKLETLSDSEKDNIFNSLTETLVKMRDDGGRDTEKDLFGNKGGYRTFLSNISVKEPCRVCGSKIIREAYMGGNIYYCPVCQGLE